MTRASTPVRGPLERVPPAQPTQVLVTRTLLLSALLLPGVCDCGSWAGFPLAGEVQDVEASS